MSIVSGLATANGVAPLLNAPKDASAGPRAGSSDHASPLATTERPAATRPAESLYVPRPVASADLLAPVPRDDGRGLGRDSRYAMFIDAVLALRLDHDLSVLPRYRALAVEHAGREIFKLDDGMPSTVSPPEPAPPTEVSAATRVADAPDAEPEAAHPAISESVIRMPDGPSAGVPAESSSDRESELMPASRHAGGSDATRTTMPEAARDADPHPVPKGD